MALARDFQGRYVVPRGVGPAPAHGIPSRSLRAVPACVRTALPGPRAPQTQSRLTAEAAGAASLCRCHGTLTGPF